MPTIPTWDGATHFPIEQWGRDHWSTLAYVECKCVDDSGWLRHRDADHLRCNPRRHRKMLGPRAIEWSLAWDNKYSTRLVDGSEAAGHDDWHCIEDMHAAGVLALVDERDTRPGSVFGGCEIRVALTPLGLSLCQQVRAHKATGGAFGTFQPSPANVR